VAPRRAKSRISPHSRRSRPGSRFVQTDGGHLYVLVAGQTTVERKPAGPLTVALPRDRCAEITSLWLYADGPRALVSAVRARAGTSG
jgi:hypothetical protein